ncbi:MAG: FAD-dependent oxidoreductase [Phycisphaerales bacterium]|nr:MAG: FAD-dependent oxidoreductase [Phycisphaerales bacterium]
MKTEVLIVGGGAGGVAAALACARAGVKCVVTEPYQWVGGQFTSQGVPPDENRWVESFGASRLYAELRRRVRRWYKDSRSLTPEASANEPLNPGGGWVSRLCAEPRVFHEVMREMLAEHAGSITVLTGLEPISADADRGRVRSVTFRDRSDGSERTIEAPIVIDATETGDLLELASIPFALGGESRRVFGELHAPESTPSGDEIDPFDQQGFSHCFAIEHRPGEDCTIPEPEAYRRWREFVPQMREGETPWTGPLFSWTVPSHNESGRLDLPLIPWPDEPQAGELELWRYRRIVDRSIYAPGSGESPPEVSLINCVQTDYWLRPLLSPGGGRDPDAFIEAVVQAMCFLYWMQTEAPRHDGGNGYPGLRLRGNELGADDGFAMAPYIREPRRLKAMLVMHEGHIGTKQRSESGAAAGVDAASALENPWGVGELFADSVAIGHYPIDLHPSCSGRQSVYVACSPFRVPLRSLVPAGGGNLVAGGKCLGVSHVVNGATRTHACEWMIGEAAGTLAAWCVLENRTPADACDLGVRTAEVQRMLIAGGMPLAWPWERGESVFRL